MKHDLTQKLTFELEADDWIWLCELLSEVKKRDDFDLMSRRDTEHLLSVLQSVADGS